MDSQGKKFGKSEGNAIWLDPKKNSPYVCYNYFMNVSDEDIERFTKLFTFLEEKEIEDLIKEHQKDPSKRYGQKKLAAMATQVIYGKQSALHCDHIRESLYDSNNPCTSIQDFDKQEIQALAQAIGSINAQAGLTLIDALVELDLCSSRGEAKQDIQANAIALNELKVTDISYIIEAKDFLEN